MGSQFNTTGESEDFDSIESMQWCLNFNIQVSLYLSGNPKELECILKV